MITHYPPVDQNGEKTLAVMTDFSRLLGSSSGDEMQKDSYVNDKSRLTVSWSTPHFPLVVMVSASTGSILRGWTADMSVLAIVTVLLDLLIWRTALQNLRGLRIRRRLQAEKPRFIKPKFISLLARTGSVTKACCICRSVGLTWR